VVKGEAMKDDEPSYTEYEDWIIHFLREIATELKKIRKEINYANTKEK
jgi:hypothetical protein